jgi:hypothetical protein
VIVAVSIAFELEYLAISHVLEACTAISAPRVYVEVLLQRSPEVLLRQTKMKGLFL